MRAARTASRLDTYARRRAAGIIAEAQAKAESLRRRATEDAYREARIQAATVLLGMIDDIGRLRSTLLEGTLAQARQGLRDHCAEAGFTTAWIERACQIEGDGHTVEPRLRVPFNDDELFLALRTALAETATIEQADVSCLRLEHGDVVLEYDPEHIVFDAASQSPTVDAQALHDGLASIASRYADAVLGPRLPLT
jgi:hypothetical protein